MLALPPFQNIQSKNIVIFRGQNGRELLSQTLRERGATVHAVETYLRCLPKIDKLELVNMWRENPLDAIIITSSLAFQSLITLFGEANLHYIQNLPFIVVGERMEAFVKAKGVKNIIVALGAGDQELKVALQKLLGPKVKEKYL